MSKLESAGPSVGKDPEKGVSIPFVITRDQRQALADLNYKGADVDAMTPQEAHTAIAAGKRKATSTKEGAQETESVKGPFKYKEIEEIPISLREHISENVKSYQSLIEGIRNGKRKILKGSDDDLEIKQIEHDARLAIARSLGAPDLDIEGLQGELISRIWNGEAALPDNPDDEPSADDGPPKAPKKLPVSKDAVPSESSEGKEVPDSSEKQRPRLSELELSPKNWEDIQDLIEVCRQKQLLLFIQEKRRGRGDPSRALSSRDFEEAREKFGVPILKIIQKENRNVKLIPKAFFDRLHMLPRELLEMEAAVRRLHSEDRAAAADVKEPRSPSQEPSTSAFEEDEAKRGFGAPQKNEGTPPRKPPEVSKAPGGAPEEARSPQEQADQGREAAELAQKLKLALDALWQQATKGMEAPAGVRFEDVSSKVSARLEQLCREEPDKAKALLGAAEHLEYMPQRQQELEREIMERSLTREIARRREAAARARAKKEEAAPRNPFSRAFWVKVGESLFGRGVRQRSSQSERLARKLADVEVFTKDMETTVEKAEIYKKTVHAMREQILLQFAQEFPALKETFEKAKAAAQEKIRTHIALSAADEDTPEGTKRVSAAALEREREQLYKAQEYITELGSRGGLVDFTSDIPVKEGEKERALNTPELKLHTDYLIAGVVGTELQRAIEGLKLKDENDPKVAYTNLKTTIEEFLKRPMGGKTADKVEKFFRNVLRRKIEDPETDQITRHMLERLFEEKKWPLQKAA